VRSAYFDTSVFLSILNGEDAGAGIRALLRELKRDKVRIYTSILTVQEVSVQSFQAGQSYDDNHAKVNKIARVYSITREIALTSAKLEASMKDRMKTLQLSEEERIGQNRRRKWDCFHIATAMCLECNCLYSLDEGMLVRRQQFSIGNVQFLRPLPSKMDLAFPDGPATLIQ
jgi:predicted nucleic acid-binding protein